MERSHKEVLKLLEAEKLPEDIQNKLLKAYYKGYHEGRIDGTKDERSNPGGW